MKKSFKFLLFCFISIGTILLLMGTQPIPDPTSTFDYGPDSCGVGNTGFVLVTMNGDSTGICIEKSTDSLTVVIKYYYLGVGGYANIEAGDTASYTHLGNISQNDHVYFSHAIPRLASQNKIRVVAYYKSTKVIKGIFNVGIIKITPINNL